MITCTIQQNLNPNQDLYFLERDYSFVLTHHNADLGDLPCGINIAESKLKDKIPPPTKTD